MGRIWLNGDLVAAADAMVPALDRGVLWGQGLFETLRAYPTPDGPRPWRVEEHDRRLRSGAELLEIPLPPPEVFSAAMDEVLGANDLDEGGVRITVTRGPGPAEPHAEVTGAPNVIVTAWTLPGYEDLYRDGVALATLSGGGRTLAGIKTTSYAASVAGRILATRAGADDALFVDGDRVLEATGANLFVVRGTRISTPPDEGVLPGVTRSVVEELARRAGYDVGTEPVVVADLLDADEVVLTSSLREVYPARSIDGTELGRRGVAEALRTAYGELVRTRL